MRFFRVCGQGFKVLFQNIKVKSDFRKLENIEIFGLYKKKY